MLLPLSAKTDGMSKTVCLLSTQVQDITKSMLHEIQKTLKIYVSARMMSVIAESLFLEITKCTSD